MENNRRFKLTALVVCIIVLAVTVAATFSGCSLSYGPEYFNSLLDDLFTSMLSGDAISVNILLSNPDALGIDGGTASLPRPQFDENEYKSNMESIKEICTALTLINYKKLSVKEKCAYDTVMNYFYNYSRRADYYYFNDNYLGSSSGWNVYLPLYLDKYAFKSKQDVQNWLNLASDSYDAFPEYVRFENKRISAGYARADFIYDGIAEQCTSMATVDDGEQHFLIGVFNDKINACNFLTEEEKTTYKVRAVSAIEQRLIPAYEILAESVKTLNGKTENLSLSNYENGKNYYALLFEETASTSDNVEVAYHNLQTAYNNKLVELRTLAASLDEDVKFDVNMTKSALQEYYNLLKTSYSADFPEIPSSVPSATLKSVPASMADFYNPASYFKSAVDDSSAEETIYVNEYNAGGYYGFDIISHEGIPGHQLQHSYFKTSGAHPLRTILGYTGYAEGWASYAQYYSAKYLPGTEQEKIAYQIECLNDELITYLYTIIDIEINYYGMTLDQFSSHSLYSQIFTKPDSAYEYMIENPAVYASYGYGCYKMRELRSSYNGTDKAFHTAVLEVGPTTFEILAKFI